ncbi:MAG: hypothetical protein KatS3mg105_3723 [Gemmatales bacterium]|nr:MAG: hypothetical protein KatS3mg105_3723 [Gemmatales bacterium]
MGPPQNFSWIEKPLLAACGRPRELEELQWLREQGIDILLSLTETPPFHRWIDEAGLMLVHVPVEDWHAPTQEQIDQCISTIDKAHENSMGVTVHCHGGAGRTGTIIACYFVAKGMSPQQALARIRTMRPDSVETSEQEQAVFEYGRRRQQQS